MGKVEMNKGSGNIRRMKQNKTLRDALKKESRLRAILDEARLALLLFFYQIHCIFTENVL